MNAESSLGAGEYEQLLAQARTDPAVVGLVLTGSRGGSDWDVRLVVEEEVLADATTRYETRHGSRVEVVVYSLASFAVAGEIGTDNAWDRYSYVHAKVVIDKLDGGIAELVAQKSLFPSDVARSVARAALDDYINSYYRALKNGRLGLTTEAHLDAAESIPPLLTALFAIHERVRPFNRFLRLELEHFPLPGQIWEVGRLLPRLRSVLVTGDPATQAALFRDVEALARTHDLGEVVDPWAPDVELRTGLI